MKSLLEHDLVKWGLVLFLVLLFISGNLVSKQEKMRLSEEERAYLRSYNESIICKDAFFYGKSVFFYKTSAIFNKKWYNGRSEKEV